MNQLQVKRKYNITLLRCAAIILVVLGHSIIIYSSNWYLFETNVNAPYFDATKKIIDAIQMPLFFSISGYLYYCSAKRKKQSLDQLIIVKFRRLIIPFITTACFWMVPIRILCRYSGYFEKSILFIIMQILTERDCGHLWFLPTLFLIFIFAKVIDSISESYRSKNKVRGILYLGVWFVVSLKSHILYFPFLQNAFAYFFWFILGGFIQQNEEIVRNKLQKIAFPILFCGIGVFLISQSNVLIKIFTILVIFVFYALVPTEGRENKMLNSIDKNSFGIYLFHSPLVYITYTFYPNINPLIMLFTNFVIFGSIAYLITSLLRRISCGALIGE